MNNTTLPAPYKLEIGAADYDALDALLNWMDERAQNNVADIVDKITREFIPRDLLDMREAQCLQHIIDMYKIGDYPTDKRLAARLDAPRKDVQKLAFRLIGLGCIKQIRLRNSPRAVVYEPVYHLDGERFGDKTEQDARGITICPPKYADGYSELKTLFG
jgi:hypothetical protein